MKKVVNIKTEYITLGQFLKYVNIVSDGVSAKRYINESNVTVNGVYETRRGRKLYPGFEIETDDGTYLIGKAQCFI